MKKVLLKSVERAASSQFHRHWSVSRLFALEKLPEHSPGHPSAPRRGIFHELSTYFVVYRERSANCTVTKMMKRKKKTKRVRRAAINKFRRLDSHELPRSSTFERKSTAKDVIRPAERCHLCESTTFAAERFSSIACAQLARFVCTLPEHWPSVCVAFCDYECIEHNVLCSWAQCAYIDIVAKSISRSAIYTNTNNCWPMVCVTAVERSPVVAVWYVRRDRIPAEHDYGERLNVAPSLSVYSGDPCFAHKSSQCIVCISSGMPMLFGT